MNRYLFSEYSRGVLLCLVIVLSGCVAEDEVLLEQGGELALGECLQYSTEKSAYFGDLHVHTSFSLDAVQFDTRNDPDKAYRFAKGEPIELTINGRLQTRAIDRPLDFVGISDHSEFMAEADICFNLNSIHYFSPYCHIMRGSESGRSFIDTAAFLLGVGPASIPGGNIKPTVCSGKQRGRYCEERTSVLWTKTQNAAERHYDRTENCQFSTFVGYEWTGTPGFKNLHRNVFFKNGQVPKLPISYFDAWQPSLLWQRLDEECNLAGTGCEAFTIPHNSNLGGGEMFNPLTENQNPYTPEQALQRARMEPLVEIYQHKGASECVNSQVPFGSNDEQCDFEQVVTDICSGADTDTLDCTPLCSDVGFGASLTGGCIEPSDFVRGTLRQGLLVEEQVGVNPFQFGFVGSTDTHNATPGATTEQDWIGHVGANDDSLAERVSIASVVDNPVVEIATAAVPLLDDLSGLGNLGAYSPGGLAVVWAEQNTRDALFSAMQKREAYATSGTRIILRMFAGDNVDDDMCDSHQFAAQGYRAGVPMGGVLPADSHSPRFAVSAMMDIGSDVHPGTALQKIQIIKGWTENGETFETVYDIAGHPQPDGSLNAQTCEYTGTGFAQLCEVWHDPQFDAQQSAFYYARVLENPSCRWSRTQCNRLFKEENLSCDNLESDSPLQACCDQSLPNQIQERAWSSPIWHSVSQR